MYLDELKTRTIYIRKSQHDIDAND